ncbi:hypothetical protein O0235_08535 [Tepidiforma flava]|uniref:Uncharacterized protein n=1 Tax=Tepidiforma flava TaxID=3004094 RepID=A0ABY7M4Y3_9CHLR|nr:hypothetical protein [Tepidiforma flava]WBL34841.1 hypothetical protein O0235_08535 [Tepidiforma flava]
MKVLRITNSNDVTPGATTSRPALIASVLEARFGEPVEMVVKTAWPNDRMPAIVGKWLDEERPDIVWLGINPFWFNYPSVPLRLRRKLGPLGDRLARLGLDAAANPVIGPSRPFRLARNLLLRTVGGDYHFEPEEVLPRIEASIRRILRQEGVVLAVWGPFGRSRWSVTRAQAAAEQRRQAAVVAALERLARDLHFAYAGPARPSTSAAKRRSWRPTASTSAAATKPSPSSATPPFSSRSSKRSAAPSPDTPELAPKPQPC